MDPKSYSTIAKYYDAAYSAKRDLNDLYLELAQRQGGPVLEIACGTGRILLAVARLGIDIEGIDFSEALLAPLRKKARKLPKEYQQRITLHCEDMRSFSLGKQFALVIIPFRSLQHLYTIEDQISAFVRAREHLRPNGVLAFDVFYPNFTLLDAANGQEIPELEWVDPVNAQRMVRRYFIRHHVNKLYQYFEGESIFRTFEGNDILQEERAPLKMNYYTYPQLLLLFKHCGFEIVEEYGSFGKDPIEMCREMIFVLAHAD